MNEVLKELEKLNILVIQNISDLSCNALSLKYEFKSDIADIKKLISTINKEYN